MMFLSDPPVLIRYENVCHSMKNTRICVSTVIGKILRKNITVVPGPNPVRTAAKEMWPLHCYTGIHGSKRTLMYNSQWI